MNGLWSDGDRRREYLSIAITMCISFVLSFAYLHHRQHALESALPALPAPAPSRSGIVMASAPAVASPPAVTTVTRPQATAVADHRPPVPVAVDEPAEAAPAEPVPVLVRLRRYPAGRIEGQVKNLSERTLTLRFVSRGREGEETGNAGLTVGPLDSQPFGTDEGMTFRSGDRLLIQSTGFQDRESAVP